LATAHATHDKVQLAIARSALVLAAFISLILSMKRSAADAEFFRHGGLVAFVAARA
jgi:hypothetical protein